MRNAKTKRTHVSLRHINSDMYDNYVELYDKKIEILSGKIKSFYKSIGSLKELEFESFWLRNPNSDFVSELINDYHKWKKSNKHDDDKKVCILINEIVGLFGIKDIKH